jgi:hypothetical protein
MKRIPARYLAGFLTAVLCVLLTIDSHSVRVSESQSMGWDWTAPPPPPSSFLKAFLAAPGVVAGLPLIIAGGLLRNDYLIQAGVTAGAAFFWYALMWYLDCARGLTKSDKPPRHIRAYVTTLKFASVILMPLAIWRGFRLGDRWCAFGAPPMWSEMVMYGIVLGWLTTGTYFTWASIRDRRRARDVTRISLIG